jgi:hypothetical protein
MSKEWKGNSNSAHAAIAAKKPGSTNKREQDDFYATDPIALEMLLVNCSKELKKEFYNCKDSWLQKVTSDVQLIWEPAAGTGNLSNYLRERYYKVVASDLKIRGAKNVVEGIDFLSIKDYKQEFKGATPRIILTNPPYSLATEFIEHALEILPEGGLYIALMNITYLAGQKRYQRVYSKGSLREIYVFSKRIECWKNGERPKDKCGSIANYAWYVFQKGFKGQPTLYWL